MKKVFKMKELDCANCAAKMEAAIARLPGVESASMSFMTQKLTLVMADDVDVDNILDEAARICKRIEPDCEIIRK